MVTLDQTVADARLGDDGNACLAQGGNVAIDRANADLEMRGDILRAHDAPALQPQHHRHETVHPVHGRQDSTGAESFGGFDWLDVARGRRAKEQPLGRFSNRASRRVSSVPEGRLNEWYVLSELKGRIFSRPSGTPACIQLDNQADATVVSPKRVITLLVLRALVRAHGKS